MRLPKFKHAGIVVALIASTFLGSRAVAQISEGGTPPSFGLKAALTDVTSIQMRTPNVPALLAEDASEVTKDVPLRFGYPFEVDYDLSNSGTWDTLADGSRLWRLRIECPQAYSINLVYRAFWLPRGAKFFVYAEDKSRVIGAFTERNNKEYGSFATAPVPGQVSVLEYWEPATTTEPGIISIQRIVHGYRDVFAARGKKDSDSFGSSGSCNNNANCAVGAEWQDDKRSAAMILTGGGFRLCSGALVNNVREDLTPYFLTANHCLGGEATWIFMFNYESPSCANVDGPTWMTVSGSILRAKSAASDFALLELVEDPPDSFDVYFAGWSAFDSPAQSVVGIHHPQGDIKKISFDYDAVTSANYGSGTGGSHWRIGVWDDGTTEPGSSGSPLFDSLTHRIVGQLHGGTASCASLTSDYYGKVAKSWEGTGVPSGRLKDWLDPDNTGTMVLDGLDPAGASFSAEPRSGEAPLDVQFTGSSFLSVDNWLWDFGDGDSGFVQSPLHQYTSPGIYDVSLEVIAGVDSVFRNRPDYVIVLADTMGGPNSAASPFTNIEIVVSANNTIPLSQIRVPVSYVGNLDMEFTGFSTVGCRTNYFENQGFIHVDPINERLTIRLISSADGTSPELAPGNGPIVKLQFTVASAASGDSTVVDLSGYSTYLPSFIGPLLSYAPQIASPTLTYVNCCEGLRGNIDGNGSVNVSDLTYLVSHLFKGGPEPGCFDEADVDFSGSVNVGDVTYMVNFLFKGGLAPLPCE